MTKAGVKALVNVAKKVTADKEERPIFQLDEATQEKVSNFIRLCSLANAIDPIVKERKKELVDVLFDLWANQMWADKKVPENPRLVIYKKNKLGQLTSTFDMSMVFQVKLGYSIAHWVDEKKLGKKSYKTAIAEVLVDPAKVGLSEANAKKLISAEVEITDQLTLADTLVNLLNSKELTQKSAAKKLIGFLKHGLEPQVDKVEDLICSADEVSSILITVKEVSLKDGFFDRILTYCETIDQMKKLVRLAKPTFTPSSVQFAVSDKNKERVKRLEQTVSEFLTIDDDEKSSK